ncbi:YeeE/YedE family protein [Meridianimarinicoccus sp. RP-17]|uniref:YeeE/YedE family protein n=1 Tax=Meridianimarinicoccus zhengii TaxID=2056810 RepID=UPI000DAE8FC6|nr:YeeE/YedE thiosulfate transporter family protein [Phycocomes zhengii]
MPVEWLYGLGGGLVIGLAGAVFLLANGRIMGASGIVGGLVDGTGAANRTERLAFLAGLIGFPMVIALLFGFVPPGNVTTSPALLIAAGLLVGVGTRLANGCTSGHGVCGISRLSLRGIVATVFYILAGGLTVVLFRHILGII